MNKNLSAVVESPGGRAQWTRRSHLRATTGALGAGVLAACAPGGESGSQAGARPRTGAPVEITFNTWYLGVMEPTAPLIKKFEEENNIKVQMDMSASNRDMAKYTAWYVSGTAPDVVNGENFSWSRFYNTNVILEISDYLKKDRIDLKRDYALMGSEVWCGKTYAMPFDADPRAVYYNKTLLRQAGAKDPWTDLKGQWTFADMEEMMVKASRVQGNTGTDVYGAHMAYNGMSEGMGMVVWSFGGTWADFENMKYTLDSPRSLEAHNFIYQWFNRNLLIPNPIVSQLGGGEKAFGQGRAVFRVRAAASHDAIKREINNAFDYDIAPFPSRTKGQPGVTIVSGNPHTISKTTKHPEESYRFVRWLAGDDVQGFWAKEKVVLPTLKKWQAEFTKDPKVHTQVFADAYKVPYGIHFRHDNTSRHYSEYGAELNNEVYNSRNKTIGDALRQLTQRMNNEVEYGSCQPYKGVQVPLKP
jgi:multiple sugar transport system substrate-binding protein